MPPPRRKPSNPTTTPAARAQQTLSFNSRSAKVTKPSIPASSKKLDKPQTAQLLKKTVEVVDDAASPVVSEEIDAQTEEQPTTAESAIEQQAKNEVKVIKRSLEEEKAAKVGEAQIKRYWKGKEEERKAPRGKFCPFGLSTPRTPVQKWGNGKWKTTVADYVRGKQCINSPSPSTRRSSVTSIYQANTA